jgi:hypothetical protein
MRACDVCVCVCVCVCGARLSNPVSFSFSFWLVQSPMIPGASFSCGRRVWIAVSPFPLPLLIPVVFRPSWPDGAVDIGSETCGFRLRGVHSFSLALSFVLSSFHSFILPFFLPPGGDAAGYRMF